MKRRAFTLRIHPAGLVIFAMAFLLWDSHFVLSAVIALLLHEGAHLLTMWLCGMRGCTVELTPFGGMADVCDFEAYSPWKRMISSIAGVLASSLTAWCCLSFAPRTAFWKAMIQSNLSLALLNILPAWPLDGARFLAASAAWTGCEARVKNVLTWVTRMIGTGFVFIGLYGAWHGVINVSMLIVGPYLCYAAREERISEKVRRFHGTGMKLTSDAIAPVSVWAGTTAISAERFAVLLGRMPANRYHLFVQLDQKSGRIQKCWTENEMLNQALSLEGIDENKA